jgi:hypothetical protein
MPSNLDLKISLTTCDCSNLIFNELTGTYSVSNPTGWGTPNDPLNDAISGTLVIQPPSGAAYTFNVFLNTFPTTASLYNYTISYTSLGLPNGLIDGLYTATYTVVTNVSSVLTTYTVTNSFLITCNLECCINTMLLDIDDFECDCNKHKKDKYLLALSILQGIKGAKECGDINTANNLITIGNKLCNNLNCTNCRDAGNYNFY